MNFIEMIKLIDKHHKITNPSLFLNGLSYIEYIEYIEGYGVVTNGNLHDSYDFDFTDYYDENWEEYTTLNDKNTFEDAIVAYTEGKLIYRNSEPLSRYILSKRPENHPHVLSFTNQDILANDWVITDKEDK